MLSYFKILSASCDLNKNKKFCWGETVVQLELSELEEDAKAALEKLGWILYAANYTICPYCSNGRKQVHEKKKTEQAETFDDS